MHNATVDSLRVLQNDTYSTLAQDILTTMLGDLDHSKMDDNQRKTYDAISRWDKNYSANSVGATIFARWWLTLYNSIWEDDFAGKKDLNINLEFPSGSRTVQLLLTDKTSKWYDDTRTQQVETRADLVNKSFDATVDTLIKKYGALSKAWEWGNVKGSNIAHLGGVDGFGSGNFYAGGASGVINAFAIPAGPSWRMIVQFGPTIKGYGVFPGGESGNPGSYYYDNLFQTWKNGQLNELLFLQNPNDEAEHIKSTITLSHK
jgi:penicillin amidase